MSGVPGASRRIDFHALGAGPYGTFLYGDSRLLVDQLGFAMARVNDPNPTWVDIRDPEGRADPSSPSELGWVAEDHLFYVSPAEAKPQDAEANMALWTVVRSDEPDAVIARLTDFLRLPPTVQVAVSRMGAEAPRPVFVVANSDRVRSYYPTEPAGVRPIIDAMLRSGVLPIFAAVGPPGAGRSAFDFVFELKSTDPNDWRTGSLTCHKAPPGSPVPVDLAIPLPSLSQAVELLARRDVPRV
jgi:hypothetical protein